jgi:hypothetical protein
MSLNALENYFSHINFSIGLTFPFGVNININGDDEYVYVIRDGFGDNYYARFNSSVFDKWSPGMQLNFRFPFHYNDLVSTGLTLNISFFNADLINNSSMGNGLIGGYFEYKFTQFSNSFMQRLSILTSLGIGIDMLNGGGKLKSAFSGDPGYYDGSKFHKPGSNMSIVGTSQPTFGFTLATKYHFSQYIFMETGYSFVMKTTVSEFELDLDGKDYKLDEQPEPLDIDNTHIIYVLIGFGL